MAKADSSKQKPTVRPVNFGAGGCIYQLSPEASQGDIYDHLSARLDQLNAMLVQTCGGGAETFHSWSKQIMDNHLWSCQMIAQECSELLQWIELQYNETP